MALARSLVLIVLFGTILRTALWLVPVVLAVPSEMGTRVASRGAIFQSHVNSRLQQSAGSVSNTQYSKNWAGAVWAKGNETFSTVTGTFTVPTPSGSIGSSAAAWVGIDGDTCASAILQTGVVFTVEGDRPTYYAWYEWYPANAYKFSDISISAGDVIKLSVVAWSANSGTATIENLSNGQLVSKSLDSSTPLCGQNVEWITEDYTQGNSLVPFADFGTVTFTNAVATGTGSYYPNGATIFDIRQNNQVLTNVSTNGTSVVIQYV